MGEFARADGNFFDGDRGTFLALQRRMLTATWSGVHLAAAITALAPANDVSPKPESPPLVTSSTAPTCARDARHVLRSTTTFAEDRGRRRRRPV